jgi:hypothetical protein
MPDTIKIVRKGDRIEPEAGYTTTHRSGATVVFTTDPEAQGVSIKFAGESPFGADKKTVGYGTPLRITAPVSADRNRNKYRYDCELIIGGRTFKTGSGGEMELVGG